MRTAWCKWKSLKHSALPLTVWGSVRANTARSPAELQPRALLHWKAVPWDSSPHSRNAPCDVPEQALRLDRHGNGAQKPIPLKPLHSLRFPSPWRGKGYQQRYPVHSSTIRRIISKNVMAQIRTCVQLQPELHTSKHSHFRQHECITVQNRKWFVGLEA